MHNYLIKKGTTDVSVELRIVDSTDGAPETGVVWNTAGIDLQYRRDGAASTAITEATLAALTTAHTDGGFLHIGNGIYRFDLPDAACASGVDKVVVHGTVTGMVVIGCVIQLTDVDMFDGVRAGLTALPNAAADAAGGLAISDAGGLDLDNIGADTDTLLTRIVGTLAAGTHNPASAAQIAVLSDLIDGGRLDLLIDAIKVVTDAQTAISPAALVDLIYNEDMTGHQTINTAGRYHTLAASILNETTATGTPTSTEVQLTAGSSVDDFYNDQLLYVTSGTGAGQVRVISDYVGATKACTVDEVFSTIPVAADGLIVRADHMHSITSIQSGLATSAEISALNDVAATDIVSGGAITTSAGAVANVDLVDVCATNTDMVAAAPTAVQNRQEMDSNSTQLAKLGTPAGANMSADIAAIKADTVAILIDTNELQGDWTNGGRLDLIIDAINTATATVTLSASERNAIADAMLDRDMSTGTDSGSTTVRTMRQSLRASRNKVTIAGGTMTVYKEDDATASWTAAITTTAGDPISDMNPAGGS